MEGELKVFKTGYNKKNNTYTENRLFIPAYQHYDLLASGPAGGLSSAMMTGGGGEGGGGGSVYSGMTN